MSKSSGHRWAIVAVLGGACSKAADKVEPASNAAGVASTTVTPIAEAAPRPADAPSRVDLLMSTTKLADAIELTKSAMTDTDDQTSPGALLFALWAADHLRWSDIAVPKNETSFALVHKDSDAARGKRMCFQSQIIQIRKEKAGSSTLFTGLTMAGGDRLASFIAVGSTGELVQESYARFCGVVIGTYDYSNSGGGKGHAVSVVGMFDLPENRKAEPGR